MSRLREEQKAAMSRLREEPTASPSCRSSGPKFFWGKRRGLFALQTYRACLSFPL